MKENRSIIHLYLKSENKHLYFGSMVAMYDNHNSNELGIGNQSLRNHFFKLQTKEYENANCIIRKGELVIKETPTKVRKSKNA